MVVLILNLLVFIDCFIEDFLKIFLMGDIEIMLSLRDKALMETELLSGEHFGTLLALNFNRFTCELKMTMEFLSAVESLFALEACSVSWTFLIKMLLEFKDI